MQVSAAAALRAAAPDGQGLGRERGLKGLRFERWTAREVLGEK